MATSLKIQIKTNTYVIRHSGRASRDPESSVLAGAVAGFRLAPE
jgi:hypothetical protein